MAPGLCCGGGEIFRESSTQSRVKRPRMAFLGDIAHGCALSPPRPLPHPSPAFPEKSPDGAAQPGSHPPMPGPPFLPVLPPLKTTASTPDSIHPPSVPACLHGTRLSQFPCSLHLKYTRIYPLSSSPAEMTSTATEYSLTELPPA